MKLDTKAVLRGLERLRDADPAFEAYGASRHRYQMRPPLAEADVVDAEALFRVRFPDDYRRFLLEVGSGGAGPNNGVYPLVQRDDGWQWDGQGGRSFGDLTEPFPYQDAWNPVGGPGWRAEPEPSQYETAEAHDAAMDEWYRWYDSVLYDTAPRGGVFTISDEGCGRYAVLVVSGPCAGEMWRDGRADGDGIEPCLAEPGTRQTFGAWYLNWLEATYQKVITGAHRPKTRAEVDAEFVRVLGPEDRARPCDTKGCGRGAVRYSVLCARHHFEMVQRRPYPF